jgi:adenylate cyclase class 2
MLEVEMKFPVADLAPIRARLEAAGAAADAPRRDSDCYFNAPDRDFAKTDEAVRVRTIGPRSFLTYKGPKRDALTKTRTEIEIELTDGPDAADKMRQLLTHLHYCFVAEVRKQRAVYHLERQGFAVEACLDQVEGIGSFVELEIQAPEADLDRARGAVQQLAAELGLGGSERRSYLEMLLEKLDKGP